MLATLQFGLASFFGCFGAIAAFGAYFHGGYHRYAQTVLLLVTSALFFAKAFGWLE